MAEIHDQTQGSQGYAASAESWLIEVERRCDPQQYNMRHVSPNVCIYKVPKPLMDTKPEAYAPTVVSLGPYHHKLDPKFSAVDEHKFEAVQRTLARLNGVPVDFLVRNIREDENAIRNFYEDSAVEWNGEMLPWMFLMDACFILEYLRSFVEERTNGATPFSLIFNKEENLVHLTILYDIIKLENQIPLSILRNLLRLEVGDNADKKLGTILSHFDIFAGFPFSPETSIGDSKRIETLEKHIQNDAYHLLDLIRRVVKDFLEDSSPNTESAAARSDGCFGADHMCKICCRRPQWMNLPTWLPRSPWRNSADRISPYTSREDSIGDRIFNPKAELLHGAGIEFKPGNVGFENKIFRRSTLSLPQMNVDDSTENVLRNLMAFEECQRRAPCPEKTVISSYIRTMVDLIESERDVSILKKEKIFRSYMRSNEAVADMFNHLCKYITSDEDENFNFEIAVKQARSRFSSQWNLWVNEFKEEHCSKPWYIIPIVATLLILAMTAVQTFYSVKNK